MEQATKRSSRWDYPLPPPFKGALNERQLRVLLTLSEFSFLRSTWLFAFDGKKCHKRFLDLLTYLTKKTGLIEKPRGSQDSFQARYAPDIYSLAKRGREYLVQHGYSAPRDDLKTNLLAHNLLAFDILADIKLTCLDTPGLRYISKEEMLSRAPEKTQKLKSPFTLEVEIEHVFDDKHTERTMTHYVADGWFGIEYTHSDASKSYRFFCLEVNHQTNVRANNLKDASHLRKMLSIKELRRQKIFATHFGITAPVICLFVQTDGSKTHNSMELLREETRGAGVPYIAFKTMQTFQQCRVAPLPDGKTLTVPWTRVGYDPLHIDQP